MVKFKPDSLRLSIKFRFSLSSKKLTILAAVLLPISSIDESDSISNEINSSTDLICFKIVLDADSPTYLIPRPYKSFWKDFDFYSSIPFFRFSTDFLACPSIFEIAS